MRKSLLAVVGFAIAATAGLVIYWRSFPRAGTRWANEVGDPWILRMGFAGGGASELGTLEHVGRTTGQRRLTPIHPVATEEGFRIIVPLGEDSQWAKNVLAAGHCRMQLHDTIYELDEPLLARPADVRELSSAMRWLATRLGFRYLRLRRFAAARGRLDPAGQVEGEPLAASVEPEATPVG